MRRALFVLVALALAHPALAQPFSHRPVPAWLSGAWSAPSRQVVPDEVVGPEAIGTPVSIGTATASSGASDCAIAQSGISAGDLVVVCVARHEENAAVQSITVGAESFTQAASSGDDYCGIWYLKAAAAHTADILVTFTDAFTGWFAFEAIRCTGIAASPLDKTHTGQGSSASPSSGATATLSMANELVIGAVATFGPFNDGQGTWTGTTVNGLGAGVGVGTGTSAATIRNAYAIVATTAAVTASKTGITSRQWGACVATFKGN